MMMTLLTCRWFSDRRRFLLFSQLTSWHTHTRTHKATVRTLLKEHLFCDNEALDVGIICTFFILTAHIIANIIITNKQLTCCHSLANPFHLSSLPNKLQARDTLSRWYVEVLSSSSFAWHTQHFSAVAISWCVCHWLHCVDADDHINNETVWYDMNLTRVLKRA